jgi:GNAT superfamily N-acetyltransferase
MFRIDQQLDEKNIAAAIQLFNEYAEWLGIDLGFQGFEKELVSIAQMYGPPHGALFVLYDNDTAIGCLGLRKIDDGVGELKRMYIREQYTKTGLGKMLLDQSIAVAKGYGYQLLRLDTLNTMIPAMKFYEKHGFYRIPPYYHNPLESAVYFEMKL